MANYFSGTIGALGRIVDRQQAQKLQEQTPQWQMAVQQLMNAKRQQALMDTTQRMLREGKIQPTDESLALAYGGVPGLFQTREASQSRKAAAGLEVLKTQRELDLEASKQEGRLGLEGLKGEQALREIAGLEVLKTQRELGLEALKQESRLGLEELKGEQALREIRERAKYPTTHMTVKDPADVRLAEAREARFAGEAERKNDMELLSQYQDELKMARGELRQVEKPVMARETINYMPGVGKVPVSVPLIGKQKTQDVHRVDQQGKPLYKKEYERVGGDPKRVKEVEYKIRELRKKLWPDIPFDSDGKIKDKDIDMLMRKAMKNQHIADQIINLYNYNPYFDE
jgi:hypothetical protein